MNPRLALILLAAVLAAADVTWWLEDRSLVAGVIAVAMSMLPWLIWNATHQRGTE